ncbi:adenine-specific methyltransferase EcoRI family protein [Tessaracoccus sp. Y36]
MVTPILEGLDPLHPADTPAIRSPLTPRSGPKSQFFALHFADFGLRKLISTSYAPNSNAGAAFYTPTLFEIEGPAYDETKSLERGRVFTLLPEDVSGDGRIDIDDLKWEYLEGDGDFRSSEVTALRDEADMVITNPPFSLFRSFIVWLAEGNKQFSVVGNMNAITYREVFPLIKANRLWKGATANSSDMVFEVPEDVEIAESDRLKAEKMGYKGNFTRLGNACWFTNVEHGRRHEPLPLMSMADNIKFSRHKEVKGFGYQRYDNFEAIEVPFVDAIPSDYPDLMGVPITFLDKYNPEQFEIVGSTEGDFPPTKKYNKKERVVDGVRKKSNTGTLSGAIRTDTFGPGTHFDVGYPVRGVYKRLFIRHRNPEPKKD